MQAVCRHNGHCNYKERTGKECKFAHTAVPAKVPVRVHNKHTQLCMGHFVSECPNADCNFAHSLEECIAANDALGRDPWEHIEWFHKEVKASEDLADGVLEEAELTEEEQKFLDSCIDEQDEDENYQNNPEMAAMANEEVWSVLMGAAQVFGVPLFRQEVPAWGEMY